ncbi:IclR family transcriptional regulator [Sciscionella marina]|uniref:IclR family transcriptional regulator n=1 Tax=Sciscionella marina TaxID=508770 RepID=UPI0003651AA7|nr:IclR family transcriptional regulator [Sciscionella marina]
MTAQHGIASVRTTLRVLEHVAQRQPVGVSELARAMDLPKTTVQRCLVTLREVGWLRVVDDQSRWAVTSKPLDIGLRAVGKDQIRAIADSYLEDLRARTDETIHLTVRQGDSLIIISRKDSRQAVRTYVELGTRAPLHATSCGLATLAQLPENEVENIINRGLNSFTGTTILDPTGLRDEIERTRKRGYSVNAAAWWRPQVCAVGSAILDNERCPIGAIAISIPSSRFNTLQVPYLGSCAIETTQAISQALPI